ETLLSLSSPPRANLLFCQGVSAPGEIRTPDVLLRSNMLTTSISISCDNSNLIHRFLFQVDSFDSQVMRPGLMRTGAVPHVCTNSLRSVLAFRTSNKVSAVAIRGRIPAPTRTGLNEYRSETKPIKYVAIAVPRPLA